jgi:hypothetical protein
MPAVRGVQLVVSGLPRTLACYNIAKFTYFGVTNQNYMHVEIKSGLIHEMLPKIHFTIFCFVICYLKS